MLRGPMIEARLGMPLCREEWDQQRRNKTLVVCSDTDYNWKDVFSWHLSGMSRDMHRNEVDCSAGE
jgi:hypothetical protein